MPDATDSVAILVTWRGIAGEVVERHILEGDLGCPVGARDRSEVGLVRPAPMVSCAPLARVRAGQFWTHWLDVQLLTPAVSLSKVYSVRPFELTKKPAGASDTVKPNVGAGVAAADGATVAGTAVGAGVLPVPEHAATSAPSTTKAGMNDLSIETPFTYTAYRCDCANLCNGERKCAIDLGLRPWSEFRGGLCGRLYDARMRQVIGRRLLEVDVG